MTCEAVTCGNSTVITMCTMQHIIQSSTCVQINAIKDAALNTLKQEIQHCLHTFMQNLGTECNRTIWFLKTRVDLRDLQDSCLDIDRSTKNTFGTLLQSWVSSRNVSMQLVLVCWVPTLRSGWDWGPPVPKRWKNSRNSRNTQSWLPKLPIQWSLQASPFSGMQRESCWWTTWSHYYTGLLHWSLETATEENQQDSAWEADKSALPQG